jgi:hypothetical protein
VSNNTVSRRSVRLLGCWLSTSLSLLACQAELKLNDGVAKPPADMAMSANNPIPAMLGYIDINKDLESPALGCTNQVSACHGGSNPAGTMALADMAAGDMTKLMSNYNQVKMRVTTTDPANSLILLKLLATSQVGMSHPGGTPFSDTNNPMYQRWLVWIQLGAPFDQVPTMGGGG